MRRLGPNHVRTVTALKDRLHVELHSAGKLYARTWMFTSHYAGAVLRFIYYTWRAGRVTQQSENGDKPVMSLFFSAGNCMHMLTKLLRTTHGSMSAMATDICIVQYIQYDIVSNCYLDLIISYSLALSPQ